ncbi:MAG: TonB-dependent receptor, partial [Acidobacteriota bacterium]
VSLQGYATVELTDIWLAINETKVVIPPLALERVTGPAATLTVEGKAAVVNTSDAARKLTLDERTVSALPLAGVRTFDALAFLAPGVAQVPQSAGTGPGVGPGVGTAGQFSVNGQRGRNNNFLVDMSDNNDQDVGVRRQGYVSLIPQSIESIEQFQIITGAYQAEFGRNSGAIVNAISKTGGNTVHGSVYGFLTDSRLNARNPFDQLDGPAPEENAYRRAQYGFAVGGPFSQNRSFWFGSLERQRILDRPERHFSVPRSAERSWFGSSPFGPMETDFTNAGYFLSGEAGRAIWSLVPLPNNPGGPYGANTFTERLNGDGDGTVFSLKTDHRFTDGHAFTARYNFTDDQVTLPVTGGGIRSGIRPDTRTQNISIFLNSVLTGSASNQLRLSYGRTRLDFQEVAGSPWLFGSTNTNFLASLFPPMPGVSINDIIQKQLKTPIQADFGKGTYGPFGSTGALGQLSIHPYSPIGVDVYNFPQSRVNNTFQYADTFSVASGPHIWKFGVDVRHSEQNSRLDRNIRPLAEFNSGFGFDVDGRQKVIRGRDLASIGYATALFQTMIPDFTDDGKADFDTAIGLRFTEYNFFVQDDWKVTSRLTLNLGVRFEYNTTPEEVNGRIEDTFADPLAGVPAQAFPSGNEFEDDRKAYDAMVAAYRSILGGRDRMYRADKRNWAPRIGLAWDPAGDGRTAVRAGYGLYYDQNISAVTSQSRNVFPRLIPLNSSGFNFPLFGYFLLSRQWIALSTGSALYPHQEFGSVDTIGSPPNYFGYFLGSQASEGGQGLAFTIPEVELKTPSAHHFHFTVEREIVSDTQLSVAYVGSKGTHLTRFRMPNGGIAGRPQFGIAGVAGGGLRILAARTLTPVARTQAGLGPYTIFENSASSNYHSLQLSAMRRFARGVQFTAAYAWSHAIDDISDVFGSIGFSPLPQSNGNLAEERASSNFDIRHRFAASFLWDLPVAKDNAVLGGWRLAGSFVSQTGQPYTVNSSFDVNNDGVLTDRLQTTAGFQANGSGSTVLIRPAAADPSLDSSLLAPPGQSGAVGRNSFRGRGLASLDLALIKLFRFGESQNLEFRAEFFNMFNRAHFGLPVRILEAPGFGKATDTSVDVRRIQFALKLNF